MILWITMLKPFFMTFMDDYDNDNWVWDGTIYLLLIYTRMRPINKIFKICYYEA